MKNNIKRIIILSIFLIVISCAYITFRGRIYTVAFDINNDSDYKLSIEEETGKIEVLDKKEMYIDFDINNYNTVQEFIDEIIYDNNYLRPSYALNYKTPIEYKTQLGFK